MRRIISSIFQKADLSVSTDCTKKLWRDGESQSFRIVKGIDLKVRVLKFYNYRCNRCETNECKDRVYSGISPEIIEQLSPVVRGTIDFVSTSKTVLSQSLITLTGALRERNTSFRAIAKSVADTIATNIIDMELMKMELLEEKDTPIIRSLGQSHRIKLTGKRLIEYSKLFAVSPKVLQEAYRDQTVPQESLIQTSFNNASIGSRQFSMDMNHVFGNKGSKEGIYGNMHVMNQYQEVCVGQAQTGKSIKESEAVLRSIQIRAPDAKVFHTDEPAAIEKSLKKIFGPDIGLLKDPFHLMQYFEGAIRAQSDLKERFYSLLSQLLFVYEKDDIQRLKDSLINAGLSDEEASKRVVDVSFLKKHRHRVRRYLNKPDDIEGVKKLYTEFFPTGVFNAPISSRS
jgi:hypothetical protein